MKPVAQPVDDLVRRSLAYLDHSGMADGATRLRAQAARIVAQAARIAELERKITNASQVIYDCNQRESALLANWNRECEDADYILYASGLPPTHWRTDGGSLQVPRIVAHFIEQKSALAAAQADAEKLRGEHQCFTCGGPATAHWCDVHRPSLRRQRRL